MQPVDGDSGDKFTETWVQAPRKQPTATGQAACLVSIYPTGASMGMRYPLGNKPMVLGRGEDCDIRAFDNSVSRHHVRIEPTAEGYQAYDLQSTNGTFVNNSPMPNAVLRDGDYLRAGNCIFRFLAGGNLEAEYHEEIYRLTIIDGLTGIYNKRFLMEALERELARSVRHSRPLALMLFDLDRFKKINDDLGHLAGDGALRDLSELIRTNVRCEDIFARYGGEEFALVLVETEHKGAVELAERLRKLVEARQFDYEGTAYKLTISLGVSSVCGDKDMTLNELVRVADERLLQAKRDGRNRVVGEG